MRSYGGFNSTVNVGAVDTLSELDVDNGVRLINSSSSSANVQAFFNSKYRVLILPLLSFYREQGSPSVFRLIGALFRLG